MFRNTFLGAIMRCVISHTACLGDQLRVLLGALDWDGDRPTVSKSMDVNLNSRRKKGGIRMVVLRCVLAISKEICCLEFVLLRVGG